MVRNELGENGTSSIRLQKAIERRYAAQNNLVLSGRDRMKAAASRKDLGSSCRGTA